MSSWNTMYLFDEHKFYTEIVHDLVEEGLLFKKHFNSQLG